MKKVALFLMIVGLAVALVACQGPVGTPGETGEKGDKGDTGEVPATAVNTPPTLVEGKVLGTQYFAMESLTIAGATIPGGSKLLGKIKLSDYFEDAEGVTNLIYSVEELSDDDKEVVDVFLTDVDPTENGGMNGYEVAGTALTATNSKSSVTGENSYLAIVAKEAGSATITLTVKDGLPGGVSTQDISVMVRQANAPPVISTTRLSTTVLQGLAKTGAARLVVSKGPVTIELPAMSFVDPNGDTLTYEVIIGGNNNADVIAANKKVLDAAINGNGDLVVTPKAAPATDATAAIPLTIMASDSYGASVATTTPINIEVNRPPRHRLYSESESPAAPDGKMMTDKAVLADLATTTFSIATTGGSGGTAGLLFSLDAHFYDDDTPDMLADADISNGVCNFSDTSGDKATVAFDSGRAMITIAGEEQGSFDVTVTCTDTKGESIEDSVTVTIIG